MSLVWLEKIEDLRSALEDGDHQFTAWEVEFIEDIYERWEEDEDWEPKLRQESKIDEIWERWKNER